MELSGAKDSHQVVIEVGGIPVGLNTTDVEFVRVLEGRYRDYVKSGVEPEYNFCVELVSADLFSRDADLSVRFENGEWLLSRGDFLAQWNPKTRQGKIRQSANPYSFDAVLRIVHTILLARAGGFLLHASSAVRNGKSYMFSGLSEAGKTTMARLAPADVQLLTDEASYIRKIESQYVACGTPFAGEFGEPGKDISAPISAVYLLAKAAENRIDPVEPAEAIRRLMRNVLFFSNDAELVRLVFDSMCAFVAAVPVFQLSFYPDQRVWELIG